MATSTLDPDNIPGPDIGNAGIDSDTDVAGTGERGTTGRDSDIEMGADIDVDRIDDLNTGEDMDRDDPGVVSPRSRHPGRPQQRP